MKHPRGNLRLLDGIQSARLRKEKTVMLFGWAFLWLSDILPFAERFHVDIATAALIFAQVLNGTMPAMAGGGYPLAGEPVLVGERGPEIFVPDMPNFDRMIPRWLKHIDQPMKGAADWPPPSEIVGERGPEVFVPDRPGSVLPMSLGLEDIGDRLWELRQDRGHYVPEPASGERPPPMTVLPKGTPMQAEPYLSPADDSDYYKMLPRYGLRFNDAAWGTWLESRPESTNMEILDPRITWRPEK
jgi:hypothetical protein